MRKLKGLKMLVATIVVAMSILRAAEKEVDYAIEDAALKTIWELNGRSDITVKKVAFLGFANDTKGVANVFQGGLIRTRGNYEFFTRNEKEFDVLLKEIEFGETRGDVMDKATIQKFGNIKGVEALLYGKVLEANKGICRVSLTLANVETGGLIWTGNITGIYSVPTGIQELSQDLVKTAINAGKELSAKLANVKIPNANVYCLPLSGQNKEESILISELISSNISSANSNLNIISAPPEANKHLIRSLTIKLANTNTFSQKQSETVKEQLNQLYSTKENSAINIYLTGQIVNTTREYDKAEITIVYKLQDLSNKTLWSSTVIGKWEKESALTSDSTILKWLSEHFLITVVGGGIIAILILGGFFLIIVRFMTAGR